MTPLKTLQDHLLNEKIDLAIINNPASIAYFTGFISEPHERIFLLFVTPEDSYLFTPMLDKAEAQAASGLSVYGYEDADDPWQVIDKTILSSLNPLKTVAIQEDSLTVAWLHALTPFLNEANLTDISDTLDQIKRLKTSEEIQKLHESGQLADEAVKVGIESLRVGISEEEVVAIIEFEMKKRGVSKMSFPTMVLFGDHAASPHGTPGKRQLQPNELVLFDLGVIYNGYASDMTRTVCFGDVSDEIKSIYQIVLEAQETAQKSASPGMTAHELDQIARDIIKEAGYGEHFMHRLGHGIGQSVHEYPNIRPGNDLPLDEDMCFSIEPGIYIPDYVGIRIEDCVHLTDHGAESFTHHPKELQIIPIKN